MDPALEHDVRLDLAEEVIARGGEVPLKATGFSMGHTIRHGEWIVVRRVAPDLIRPGDIVLHRIPSTFVAHRVIRRWRDGGDLCFLTKGDGHLTPDRPLRGADVVARVLGVRRGGRVVRFDGRWGRLIATLLLWHSLALWGLFRACRPNARIGPSRDSGRNGIRRLLLLPQALLVRLWNRTAHRTRD